MFAALLAKFGPIAARAAFSLLVQVLQKTGVLNPVEAKAVNMEHALVNTVEHLKTYQEYPTGKNGASDGGPQA